MQRTIKFPVINLHNGIFYNLLTVTKKIQGNVLQYFTHMKQ